MAQAKLLLEDVAHVSAEANWWHPRVRIIENWLREDANRASIPDDGTEEVSWRCITQPDCSEQRQTVCFVA
jgi:hypothetical protein